MVRALATAYGRAADMVGVPRLMRIGLPARVARGILRLGLSTPAVSLVRDCALLVFMFIAGCRASTAAAVRPSDVVVSGRSVAVVLVHRKGRSRRNPYVLRYPANPDSLPSESPDALLSRWGAMRPVSDCYFALAEEEQPSTATASYAVAAVLNALAVRAPAGCSYSTHSLRIGTYNELLGLGFPRPWLMQHMNWDSEHMMQVYYDTRITVTDDSKFFFAHLL